MTRQQRRAREKADQDTLRRSGLPLQRDMTLLFAQTRVLLRILKNTASPARAAEAARHNLETLERSIRYHTDPAPLECRKGCSFCCHNMVAATAPEIFLLARHLKALRPADFQAALARIQAVDAAGRDLPPLQRYRDHIGCGLLVDGLCSAYEARPTPCRTMVSASVAACEASWRGEPARIPVPQSFGHLKSSYSFSLIAALRGAGLDTGIYELNHALRIALETDDAEARWLAGEDVFAGVQRDMASGAVQPQTELFLSVLAAGAAGEPLPANPWIG
ncbi:MAG: YkgJ family cysteine cluster protein [Alphaproteobacteria bacterium]|nr:YkgJ family cysteine cluster protein [Alphaproteobacteria bacterium]MBU0796342.1 YkgJ family cysteine cluster protein [Alphaproteobacteria bacterium]MBU0887769.1 YkgJ family cysteine cluster protein [Alphaproteobacteria bacterium]MBU1815008.1 YkgJ family cysteine cluster protein [Alphaproteobacteria bacterium]